MHRIDAGPLLLYDENCNFCVWTVDAIVNRLGGRSIRTAAIQSPEGRRALGSMPEDEQLASFHLVDADGIHSGGEALVPLAELLPRAGAPLAAVLGRLPAAVRQGGYGLIAANRIRLSRFVPAGAKAGARARVEAREANAP